MADESPLDGAGKRKRQRKPNPEGRIQFGLTVEFSDSPEARQRKDNIQRRLDDARRSLGIISRGSTKTTRTGNADLLEALLNTFECQSFMSSSSFDLSSASTEKKDSHTDTPSPAQGENTSTPTRVTTPHSSHYQTPTTSRPRPLFQSPSSQQSPAPSPVESQARPQHPLPTLQPQKVQISSPASEDDEIFLCSGNALKKIFSFFTEELGDTAARCPYCRRSFDMESLNFNRQGHVGSVRFRCRCGDSFTWLTSPIIGADVPKYYVNVK